MVIVQHASGPHAALLQSTAPIHARYAKVWGLTYVHELTGATLPGAHWRKLDQLLKAMDGAADGEIFLWMDPDTLIVWPWTDLRSVLLPENDFGAVLRADGFYNAGVFFLRKSPAAVQYLRRCLEGEKYGEAGLPADWIWQVGTRQWFEQEYLNALLKPCGLKAQAINRDYNDYPYISGPNAKRPCIRAWHGEQFVCKMRGLSAYIPKASFLLELKEHGISESEAATLNAAG